MTAPPGLVSGLLEGYFACPVTRAMLRGPVSSPCGRLALGSGYVIDAGVVEDEGASRWSGSQRRVME